MAFPKITQQPLFTLTLPKEGTEELQWLNTIDRFAMTFYKLGYIFLSPLALFYFDKTKILFSSFYLYSTLIYFLASIFFIFIFFKKPLVKYYNHLSLISFFTDIIYTHLIVFALGVFENFSVILYPLIMFMTMLRMPNYPLFILFSIQGFGGFQTLLYLTDPHLLWSRFNIFLSFVLWIFWIVSLALFKYFRTTRLQLRNSIQSLSNIIESLTSGLIMYDTHGVILLVNNWMKRLGIKKEEVVGQQITKDISSLSANLYQILFDKKKKKGQPLEIAITSPQKMDLQINTVPVEDTKGKITGFIKIVNDISREKAIDQMKSEFISIAAHQLRTPLSAIKWSLKMILDGDLGKVTPEQTELLAKGYLSNERMINLVNDLLNVSRIEEGRFQYEFVTMDLEEIIDNLLKEMEPTLATHQIKLNIKKEKLPGVKVDPQKIRLALQNVLDNAIRYTLPGGEVTVALKYDTIKNKILVIIKDSGVGIPKDEQAKIFSKFFRSTNVIKMETEGSGLGLFIVKNIIEKHQGKIWFKSEENKGTTFYIMLPCRALPAQKEQTEFEKFISGF